MTKEKKAAGQKGGAARAAALTDERKKEIAQRGALARWGAKATHRGSFNEQFRIDVDCYVLNDAQKTPVISQRGMGPAIGFSRRGSRLKVFVNSKTMDGYIGRDLLEKIENPLIFQLPGAAAGVSAVAHGYDATILIDLCNAITAARADGKLSEPRYAKMVEQARIITSASAKSGIRGLIYALAGYDPTREEVIEAFKFYVQQEARDYEREFPPQLYAEWYRLYQLQKPVRGRPWKAKHLTIDHVYHPLARSNGKILKLTREQRDGSESPRDKLHQFLSEVGVKALRTHLGQVLGIARISADQAEYERYIRKLFGQPELFDSPAPLPQLEVTQ